MRLRRQRSDQCRRNGAGDTGCGNFHVDFGQLAIPDSVFEDTSKDVRMSAAKEGALFGKVHIDGFGEQCIGKPPAPHGTARKGAQNFHEPLAGRFIARGNFRELAHFA